jgi:hypothetical protein
MSLKGRWQSTALGFGIAVLLAVSLTDLALEMGRAVRRPGVLEQVFLPQRACGARSDACRLVEGLRSIGARTFDVSEQIDIEVYQRVIELAFPDRVMRGAKVTVGLCRDMEGSGSRSARVADAGHPGNRDADFCIADRR